MIEVPAAFASATINRESEKGRQWINRLPQQVEALCRQWQLLVDGPPMHGYLALAIPVQRGDQSMVLKVSWIDPSTVDEAAALAAWQGQGAVLLLESQPAAGAMLLERLDHGQTLNQVEIEKAVVIAGRLLRRLAIPAPDRLRPLPLVAAEIARNLPERWQQSGRPMTRQLIDYASDLASQLGPSSQELLVNYDLHYADVLAGQREPWLAVDPKVIAGDPEYGLAQLLWCRLEEIEAQGGLEVSFRRLVEAAELDLELARAWTIVRCVDYWLWGLSVGLTEDPAKCHFITEHLVSTSKR